MATRGSWKALMYLARKRAGTWFDGLIDPRSLSTDLISASPLMQKWAEHLAPLFTFSFCSSFLTRSTHHRPSRTPRHTHGVAIPTQRYVLSFPRLIRGCAAMAVKNTCFVAMSAPPMVWLDGVALSSLVGGLPETALLF